MGTTILVMIRDPTPLVRLGENIRKMRKQKSLSQEEFSHLAQLDRSYLGQIERGERNISFNNLHKIANALGASVAEIVEGI